MVVETRQQEGAQPAQLLIGLSEQVSLQGQGHEALGQILRVLWEFPSRRAWKYNGRQQMRHRSARARSATASLRRPCAGPTPWSSVCRELASLLGHEFGLNEEFALAQLRAQTL